MLNKDIYDKACLLLARREYAIEELRLRLQRSFMNKPEINEVIQDLEKKNYLSDLRACRMFILSQHKKHNGPLKIKAYLQGKGIDRLLADRVFQDLDLDFTASCLAFIHKKGLKNTPRDFARVFRKGFYYHNIGKALERLAKPQEFYYNDSK